MQETEVVLERHEQRISVLEREMSDMKQVQTEIRSINETLVTLATLSAITMKLKFARMHLPLISRRPFKFATVKW